MVRLDWVSTEDGGHILTAGIGSKIFLYTQVNNAIIIIQVYQMIKSSPFALFLSDNNFGLFGRSFKLLLYTKFIRNWPNLLLPTNKINF